jgi:glycosyltransferase involved in cell wall biosynthesis
MSIPTVCLIGPGHLASNPRLVKEADALHAAGYTIRVVSGTSHPLIEPLDKALLACRAWQATRIPLGSKWNRVPQSVGTRLSKKLVWSGWTKRSVLVARAESELTGRLAKAAASLRADLYIGHYLPGLYAAWKAACRHGTEYGFDAEDSHIDELQDTAGHRYRRAARESLERRLLRNCHHLTAASPHIAEAYEKRYGKRPVTNLNVFPLTLAPPHPITTPYLKRSGPPTLYWFSQTIGPGRGLEAIIAAMGKMKSPVILHLLGIPATGYREQLEAYAGDRGVSGRIVWHPPTLPDEMVRIAAGYDLGLALELTEPPNRAICLTNKAFTYLLAGVPVVLSRTHAQEWLAREIGEAGILIDLNDATAIAARLDNILTNPQILVTARSIAWKLGRERFNWDIEQKVFLESVRNRLGLPG